MSGQPSSTWAVNMSWGISDRSSEVRTKHALAGIEGHSHLVIWVNYKWGAGRKEGRWAGQLSFLTHTYKHTPTHSLRIRITARMHGLLCWAWGLPWLKSLLPQPGGTGEKFTNTAIRLFFIIFLSLCFSLRASHKHTKCSCSIWTFFSCEILEGKAVTPCSQTIATNKQRYSYYGLLHSNSNLSPPPTGHAHGALQ